MTFGFFGGVLPPVLFDESTSAVFAVILGVGGTGSGDEQPWG
jgi:hypothetical protein